jgi:ribosomal protein S15P/S13E
MSFSQIGNFFRDRREVGRVENVTGNKILRVLKANGLITSLSQKLYCLIKKATNLRKHFDRSKCDIDGKYRLILLESRFHRLAGYSKVKRILSLKKKRITESILMCQQHSAIRDRVKRKKNSRVNFLNIFRLLFEVRLIVLLRGW